MDILTLLDQAKSAGISVEARGDQLFVQGPKRAMALIQDIGRQKDAVLAMLSKKAHPVAMDPKDGKLDTDGALKPSLSLPIHSCTTVNSATKPSGIPTRSTPATITYKGKTYEVATINGMWFFRQSVESGWTACSKEFVEIVENLLQQSYASRCVEKQQTVKNNSERTV